MVHSLVVLEVAQVEIKAPHLVLLVILHPCPPRRAATAEQGLAHLQQRLRLVVVVVRRKLAQMVSWELQEARVAMASQAALVEVASHMQVVAVAATTGIRLPHHIPEVLAGLAEAVAVQEMALHL
jgi:hypothetical protein